MAKINVKLTPGTSLYAKSVDYAGASGVPGGGVTNLAAGRSDIVFNGTEFGHVPAPELEPQ